MKYETNRKCLKGRNLTGFEYIVDEEKLKNINAKTLEIFCDWDIDAVATAYTETIEQRNKDSFAYFVKVFISHHDNMLLGIRKQSITNTDKLFLDEMANVSKLAREAGISVYERTSPEGKVMMNEAAKRKDMTIDELESWMNNYYENN